MKKHLFCACLLLSLFACHAQNRSSSISLDISQLGEEIEAISFYNIEYDCFGSFTTIDTIHTLDFIEPMILSLDHNEEMSYVFIKPGEQLRLTKIGGEHPYIGVANEQDNPENKILNQYRTLVTTQSHEDEIPYLSKLSVDSFLVALNQKYEGLQNLLDQMDDNDALAKGFIHALENRLNASKGLDLLAYSKFYKYWHQSYPELPDHFYNDISKIDFTNSNLLSFKTGEYLLNEWTSKDVDFEDFDNKGDYFSKLKTLSDSLLGDGITAQFRRFDLIYNQINFGDGLLAAESMIDELMAGSTNKYLIHKLEQAIEPWLNLKVGMMAPDFTGMRTDGTNIKLSDLKGKRVYIDVWATWCRPCIAEIPALKSLEAALHDQNITFVSVSIDQSKDKEKWQRFIVEKELTGIQLLAYNDWESELVIQYNITGIPRFLLIDEQGRILSANAPRPSDPKIKDYLTAKI